MDPTHKIPILIIGGGIVECHSGTPIHPRTRSVNARTMEIFRHLGIEGRVRKAGTSLSPSFGMYLGSSLKEVIETKSRKMTGGGRMLMKELIESIRSEVRFYTECFDVEQDGEGVTATLKDQKAGTTSTIRALYLIPADGANSTIRIYGLFMAINNDRWVFHLSYDPSNGEKPSDFPPERCRELLRIAIDIPEIEMDIKSILPWEPTAGIAEHAAHQMPPWEGQGSNSGIADAHNLAWKLAAVLKGHTGQALLEAIPLISGHGYGYASNAICEEDTSLLGGLTWRSWTLPNLLVSIDGRPGRRAPHVWVEIDEKCISNLDLFGKHFVLLAGANGASWLVAARELSTTLKIEIAAHCIGPDSDLIVPKGIFESAAGISSQGTILAPPDDFFAWRMRRRPHDIRAGLGQAMRQILALNGS
ncbi:hypothetical protein CC78DRAFT_602997 [Lojkania enalia]|uniref:FAD-binding domain-containing protein n=1 Tax=Lojkania enalia TaxID=147567 RepID=A0A9P4KCK0_9PLEO|nr:hypothetical protein CC78DRAFT_602997 [Didymosphaeria enalia]